MNYRHAFHAGNFADVAKHLALVAILLHLRKKDAPFAVIDTHAGRGLYDLASGEAARTGEAEAGIGRILEVTDGPELLQTYLELVRGAGAGAYPGSPLIAARLLRDKDRLVAIEKHKEDFPALARALAPFRRARAVEDDGYERLLALLPPPERRGLVLIDPPYEAADEFAQAARAVEGALRRFATGIVAVWYPVKSEAAARAFQGEVMAAGPPKALALTIEIATEDERLSAAGLLVINPPFGFAQSVGATLDHIKDKLGPAAWRVDMLVDR